MNRRKVLGVLSTMLAGASNGMACLWDTDTLADEVAIQASSLDLILGQFPHHGDTYYKMRIARILKQVKMTQADLNDIAVAYVRTKNFPSAEKYLAIALKRKPNHYETLSNIGVTAKKQGDFTKGAKYIAKALAIKPAGHMGLGDWYLKALRWREKHEEVQSKMNSQRLVAVNYLGMAYKDAFIVRTYAMEDIDMPKNIDQSKHAQMIRNDQSYADGFLVFGDHLVKNGALQLAFLAHTRAMMLGHQNPEEIRRRRSAYLKEYTTFPGVYGKKYRIKKPWNKGVANAEEMIKAGQKWLEEYQSAEAELLQGKMNEKEVTIKMVEARLVEKKIARVRSV